MAGQSTLQDGLWACCAAGTIAAPVGHRWRCSIALFTEHCGHHVFPYHEARVFSNGVLAYEKSGG
jgi:hypothetical protein